MLGKKRIAALEGKISELYNQLNEFKVRLVSCENCGCVVDVKNAVKGESKIKTRQIYPSPESVISKEHLTRFINIYFDEYIYNPYYCKRCDRDKKISEFKNFMETNTRRKKQA